MIQDEIHRQIVAHLDKVDSWFRKERQGLFFPFYSSFDIRDSGFKVAPVDANIFPAGVNNICSTDLENAVGTVKSYFQRHYPHYKDIILLTEEHTQNPYYWDNVRTLFNLLQEAELNVVVAMPRNLSQPIVVQCASGTMLTVYGSERKGDQVIANGKVADLVISNNDFSDAYRDWVHDLSTPINPPHSLGWHQRKKDEFFKEYNQLADQFCHLIGVDPLWLTVETQVFKSFDINDEKCRLELADQVDDVLANLEKKYKQRKIDTKPFVFIKNNSGTYGLGVIQAETGDEIRSWSYKSRKKMKAAKGGRDIEQVIIQEGIPSLLKSEGATAEPTIYMIGCQLAGGFLRTHGDKSPRENLNSPGAVFRRLCVSDLKVNVAGHPMENVYGWAAKLGFLAIAREAKIHQITCPSFVCHSKEVY
ncbi:MAG: glutamate--cysteine ligase [Bdellovibrionales bacterium]|nr:glutamate--cysteine ligase [Bdellovibrionales bacterium]